MSGYIFLPQASTDLDDIWDFIAEDSIDASDRVLAEIHAVIRRLVSFPNQGHRRPDLTSRPLRFKRVHHYFIAYAPDETPLLVAGIIHGKRSPKVIAAILRGRE
jgi:toxin ParE1/3/4